MRRLGEEAVPVPRVSFAYPWVQGAANRFVLPMPRPPRSPCLRYQTSRMQAGCSRSCGSDQTAPLAWDTRGQQQQRRPRLHHAGDRLPIKSHDSGKNSGLPRPESRASQRQRCNAHPGPAGVPRIPSLWLPCLPLIVADRFPASILSHAARFAVQHHRQG